MCHPHLLHCHCPGGRVYLLRTDGDITIFTTRLTAHRAGAHTQLVTGSWQLCDCIGLNI